LEVVHALGGALVVHVDTQAPQALAPKLRAALASARAGAAPTAPASFDPRRRLAELFLGRAPATGAELQSLAARFEGDEWIVSP
jgi:hypothetical protein